MKIAVAGGTGFIGSRLVNKLHEQGEQVLVLTRNIEKAKRIFPAANYPNISIVYYNPPQLGAWQTDISTCDAVVNLAGTPIASGRWTSNVKQDIITSRLNVTNTLVTAINQANPKPTVLINASAIGYYGTNETTEFTENSPSGNDFLAQVCQSWETAAQAVTKTGTRLVILRTGIVLGQGGAVAKMLLPFQLFAGGPIGSGKQWVSWIHLDDLVNLIIYALKQSQISGIYNATAPHPVMMKEFCQALGNAINRPSWFPVPNFALEVLLGDASILVLEGQKVLPSRTLASGFTYQYINVETALKQVLS